MESILFISVYVEDSAPEEILQELTEGQGEVRENRARVLSILDHRIAARKQHEFNIRSARMGTFVLR